MCTARLCDSRPPPPISNPPPNTLHPWYPKHLPSEGTWDLRYPTTLWTEWLIDTSENITFPQLRWRAVLNKATFAKSPTTDTPLFKIRPSPLYRDHRTKPYYLNVNSTVKWSWLLSILRQYLTLNYVNFPSEAVTVFYRMWHPRIKASFLPIWICTIAIYSAGIWMSFLPLFSPCKWSWKLYAISCYQCYVCWPD